MDYISIVFLIYYFKTFRCPNMVILAKNAVVHCFMYFSVKVNLIFIHAFISSIITLGGRNYTKVSNNNGNTVKLHTEQAKNHACTHNPRIL